MIAAVQDQEELKLRIALTLITGVGHVTAKSLVSYCGSVEGVFRERKANLEKIPGIGPVTAEKIIRHNSFEEAESECRFIQKHGIQPLFYLDKNYPARLKNCSDAPVMLYFKGTADLNHPRIISVVGTRNATDYGRSVCEKIIEDLKAAEVIIVSGLAYGIDITAHKAALKNEMQTIGVLGHGLDRLYPSIHRSVAEKMMQQGGLLTEYMTGTKPDKENFPQRNRIVAGIADAVLVVEAAVTGGALITADIANSYNRDVFALPGKVTDVYSEGCNQFIKTNKAALIQSAADILYFMGWESGQKKKTLPKQHALFVELNDDEKTLIDLISRNGKMDIDSICSNFTMPVSKVSSALLNLEFKGVVKSLPGKLYEVI